MNFIKICKYCLNNLPIAPEHGHFCKLHYTLISLIYKKENQENENYYYIFVHLFHEIVITEKKNKIIYMEKSIGKNIIEINQLIEIGKTLLDIFPRKWSFHTGMKLNFHTSFSRLKCIPEARPRCDRHDRLR